MKPGRFVIKALPFKSDAERRRLIYRNKNRNVNVTVSGDCVIVERKGVR